MSFNPLTINQYDLSSASLQTARASSPQYATNERSQMPSYRSQRSWKVRISPTLMLVRTIACCTNITLHITGQQFFASLVEDISSNLMVL